MWTYDDWGGWYDHVKPPEVDKYGYGFRAPALLVSPYAKKGEVNHTTIDFTSQLKFIENNWERGAAGRERCRSERYLLCLRLRRATSRTDRAIRATTCPRASPTGHLDRLYAVRSGASRSCPDSGLQPTAAAAARASSSKGQTMMPVIRTLATAAVMAVILVTEVSPANAAPADKGVVITTIPEVRGFQITLDDETVSPMSQASPNSRPATDRT